MITNKPLVAASAILAFGCGWLNAATTVGYYTDGTGAPSGTPAAAITANGYTAVQITNLVGFNLSTIQVLLINESSLAPSPALVSQAAAISNWVAGGGILAIHDRNVCRGICTPVPGGAGISFVPNTTQPPQGLDINVETAGTLVTNGPSGVINDSNLDIGFFSNQGYVAKSSLPAGAIGILNNGTSSNEVAVIYHFGSGWVYYSTIPLDYFLSGAAPAAFSTIYAPNMVAYLGSLVVVLTPTPGAVNPTGAAAAPSLSEWGMGILAILLIAGAALALPSRPGAGTSS